MKKNDPTSFFEPQRQSTGAIVVFIYNFFVRILRGFWPVLLVLFFRSGQKQSNTELLLNSVVIIGGGASLILSIISYFRYFYHLEEDQLVIQKGVFNQSRVKLPFERIQNINIEQNVLHRLLNVVSLRIDSAGSKGSEVSIEALGRPKAEAIRQYVLTQKREARGEASASEEQEEFALPQSMVLQLDMGDLIRVGVTQNHLRTAGIIVGTIFGFVFTLADALGEDFWDQLVEKWQSLSLGIGIFTSLALVLIFVAFVITLVRTITRHYNLRFYEDRDGFTLKEGLFNQRETALRKEKIQVVRWKDNPLRRALGIFVLQIRQATSGGGGRSDQVTIPGCQIEQVNDVVFSSFPGIDTVDYRAHQIDAAYLWWYFRYVGLLPLLLFTGLWIGTGELRFIIPAVGIPVFAFFYLRGYYRRYRLKVASEYLRIDSGVIGHSYLVMPIFKVQSIVVQQSFYQRRKGLADVVLYSAGGSERIPFLPVAKAHALRDYVLYRVEKSTRSWM